MHGIPLASWTFTRHEEGVSFEPGHPAPAPATILRRGGWLGWLLRIEWQEYGNARSPQPSTTTPLSMIITAADPMRSEWVCATASLPDTQPRLSGLEAQVHSAPAWVAGCGA